MSLEPPAVSEALSGAQEAMSVVDRVALRLLRIKAYGTLESERYDEAAASQWRKVLYDEERAEWQRAARELLADVARGDGPAASRPEYELAAEAAEAQRQARVWKNLHAAAAQSRDELAAELKQAVDDWGRNDEQVLAENQRLADEVAALKEKRAAEARTIRAMMAGNERIAEALGWSEATSSDLMAEAVTHLKADRDGWKLAAEAEAELLSHEQAERRLAHTALLAQLSEATALVDDMLAWFAMGEKGHPGRPCARTGWVDETAIARLRERRAALESHAESPNRQANPHEPVPVAEGNPDGR